MTQQPEMEPSPAGAPPAGAPPAEGRTLFLVVPTGYSARYLLRTDVLPALKEAGARVVILTPNADEEYFRKEFEDVNVFVERLEVDRCSDYYAASPFRRQFVRVRADTLSDAGDLITLDDKNKDFRRVLRSEHPVVATLLRIVVSALRRSRTLRRGFVALESRLFPGNFHAALFRAYRPDLVVTTSVGYFWADFITMREAKRHGAKTLAAVLSWDNPSSKGLGGAHPDHVVAWSETMKRELVGYLDFRESKVSVCGVAHWDIYHRDERVAREGFFGLLGLDPARKTILFGTKTPRPYPNHEIVAILGEAVERDRLGVPCQLLIRLHPGYFEPGVEPALERMMALRDRYRNVVFYIPEVVSRKLLLDMPASEIGTLDAMLHYSDVLVSLFSTLVIEAAICDLPIVNVCFDGREDRLIASNGTVVSTYRSILVDEKQVHNRRVVETGGAALARTPEELIARIREYLADPARDRAGRERIVEREAGPNRGHAGATLGALIADLAVGRR